MLVNGSVASRQAAGAVCFERCDVQDLLRELPAHQKQAGLAPLVRSMCGSSRSQMGTACLKLS